MEQYSDFDKKSNAWPSNFMLYIKMILILIVTSAFVVYIATLPNSTSFFTAYSKSEPVTYSFPGAHIMGASIEEPLSVAGEEGND